MQSFAFLLGVYSLEHEMLKKKHSTNARKKPKKHQTSKIDVDINLIHTLGGLKSR
jgi:hypothetical protein